MTREMCLQIVNGLDQIRCFQIETETARRLRKATDGASQRAKCLLAARGGVANKR